MNQTTKQSLYTLAFTALFIAAMLVGAKMAVNVQRSKIEMRQCQNFWVSAGFSEDEAKAECRR